MSLRRSLGTMFMITLLVAGCAACSSGGGVCEPPPFAAGGSIDIATSCPMEVATSTAVYFVSCLRIPERALGTEVDVTSRDGDKWGSAFGVEGKSIRGLPVEEVFALSFTQWECGLKNAWISAFSPDMSRATELKMEGRFDATFSD